MGLNTADLTEGYDISGLNRLAVKRVPVKYRHYFYEGLAISLMHRRHNELMENIEFINTVPLEYRHYFLLGLGRLIGDHFKGKMRQDKLKYAINKFSPAFEDYLGEGFITSMPVDGRFLEKMKADKEGVKEKYLPYLYRTIPVYFFDGLPREKDILNRIKEFGIDRGNQKYFYYGIIEAFFKRNNNYAEEEVRKKVKQVISCNWIRKEYLYEGLGLSLGHLTFGHISKYAGLITAVLNDGELTEFYRGYCLSLKERYGKDADRIKELIGENVGEELRKNL